MTKRLWVGAAALVLGLVPTIGTVPADAASAGAYVGTMTYLGGGIPPTHLPYPNPACRETRFEMSLDAAVSMEVGGQSFDGVVTVHGNGRSGFDDEWRHCERMLTGSGALHISVFGTDPNGATLECEQLSGGWMRLETVWTAGTYGGCAIDGVPFDHLCFCFIGTWAPTPVGAGVALDTTGAVLAGSLLF